MGFTYKELDFLGKEWKVNGLSGIFLVNKFKEHFGVDEQVASQKVENFLKYLKLNRHKSICLPPQIHLTNYNTEGFNDSRPKQYVWEGFLAKKDLEEFKDCFN